jgi:O-antigen/teichoic acid export membrane protein
VQAIISGLLEMVSVQTRQEYWIYAGKENFKPYAAIAFLIAVSVTEKYTSLFNGKHLFSLVNRLLTVSNGLIFLVFLVLLLSKTTLDVQQLILLYIGLAMGQAVVMILFYHVVTKSPLNFDSLEKNDFKIFFSYSLLAFAANFLQFLAYRIDYWFIDYFRNDAALGIYALAVRLVQLFWILPLVYASIIFPKVSAGQQDYDHQPLLSLVRVTNTVNLIAGVLAVVSAYWLLPFLFGKDYRDSVAPFLILMPGVIAFAVTTLLASWFAGMQMLKVNLTGSAICFLVIIVLDLLLIPRFGIKGAALASSIGYFTSTLYSVVKYCNITQTGLNELLLAKAADWEKARVFFKGYLKFRK